MTVETEFGNGLGETRAGEGTERLEGHLNTQLKEGEEQWLVHGYLRVQRMVFRSSAGLLQTGSSDDMRGVVKRDATTNETIFRSSTTTKMAKPKAVHVSRLLNSAGQELGEN